MKKLLLLTLISFLSFKAMAQEKRNFYVEPKINVAAACIAIFNPAVEFGFGKFSAIEFSNVSSFAKKNYLGSGEPFIFMLNMLEYRAYPWGGKHKGFFAGANLGWDMYKTSKNIIPTLGKENPNRDYDWGMGVTMGATIGYKYMFKRRFGIEASISGGWHHSQHEPYLEGGVIETEMNATAEWLPYKAGLYLTYRF